MDFFELTTSPVDIGAVARRIVPPECGATVTLDGYVREFTKGKQTLYLVYEAYKPMALREMEKLVASIVERRNQVRELITAFRNSTRQPFPSWGQPAPKREITARFM